MASFTSPSPQSSRSKERKISDSSKSPPRNLQDTFDRDVPKKLTSADPIPKKPTPIANALGKSPAQLAREQKDLNALI